MTNAFKQLAHPALGHFPRRRWASTLGISPLLVVAMLLASGRCVADEPPGELEKPKVEGHWGEDAVGFRWLEDDSRDARWNEMDTGPFMTSALATPTGMVNKSLSVRVGDASRVASVCFDLQQLSLRCGWTDGFLTYTPARYGVTAPPRIDGKPVFTAPAGPGWLAKRRQYHGLFVHGKRIVLSYSLDGVQVLDSPGAAILDDGVVFTRSLQIEASGVELVATVASPGTAVRFNSDADCCELTRGADAPARLRVRPHADVLRVTLLFSDKAALVDEALAQMPPPVDLRQWTQPGPRRWTEAIVTRGTLGVDSQAYAIDTITLPFDNPYKALFFVSGHDFFSTPARVAICTLHGDVWLVEGVDGDLDQLHWTRCATGLFQPLGLRIVNDKIYVLGRDQITRLHDVNGDGEADFYESFNNGAETSPGGHDFSTCLETDADGNFYYVSQRGVHRISSDGKKYETIATGLRNPNGLSVAPHGAITAAPQEGEWTPASAVVEVTEGGYYGYGGPHVTPNRPLGYDPPLFWIPRRIDNSTGGQVWVEDDRWGPLSGSLLTLSYGQCRALLNPLEPRRYALPERWPLDGDRHVDLTTTAIPGSSRFVQGGSIALPVSFDSGVMRGRFNPHDGQLYVSGLRGWVSAAVRDGCLQRVRYTGQRMYLPTGVRTLRNGLALTFSNQLDRETAEDPGSYQVEQWNYQYSANYGSADHSVKDPAVQGHDEVAIRSATLIDSHTVFLEIDDLRPVMQMSVAYSLKASDGHTFRDFYYHTLNAIPSVGMRSDRLTRRASEGGLAEDRERNLKPGLLWRFRQNAPAGDSADGVRQDSRVGRMAALYVPEGSRVTPFMSPGPFWAEAVGFLRVALRESCTFSVQGRGEVRLRINDQDILFARGEDLRTAFRRTVGLHQGYNRIECFYRSPPEGPAELRVLWSSDAFLAESIPPTALLYDARDRLLADMTQLRAGRYLVVSLRCLQCHALGRPLETTVPPVLQLDAPDLSDAGRWLNPPWIAQWLADPASVRNNTTMPHMLGTPDSTSRQQAADLAALLATMRLEPSGIRGDEPVDPSDEAIAAGETLYEDLGCMACHRLPQLSQATDSDDRTSLDLVHRKYVPGALREFLRDPHRRFRSSRMPDFQLSEAEATALSLYLRSIARGQLATWTAEITGDAVRGERIFQSQRCAACHVARAETQNVVRSPIPLAHREALDGGCLAEPPKPAHAGPWYPLSTSERSAIRRFLVTGGSSLANSCEFETGQWMIDRYGCKTCHDRDTDRSTRIDILSEEGSGRIPPPLPSLTWTGEKLFADWTRRYLAGDIGEPIRPWLPARMPRFPAQAETLARALAQQHGWPATKKPSVTVNADLAEIGRQLCAETGLDCRQCHAVGSLRPRGDDRTQIALGVNFHLVRDRLRKDYYQRFVFDPTRYDAMTRMLKLSADGKTTKLKSVFDGDAQRQFEAIWHYIHRR